MNPVDDYTSETDESDEDFCPESEGGGAGNFDTASEEDSDDISNVEQPRVLKKGKQTVIAKEEKYKFECERLEEPENRKCRTRQTDRSTNNKGELGKDVLESDEEDKSKTDALWAHFLSDVKTVSSEERENSNQSHCPAGIMNGISIKGLAEKPKEERQSGEPTKPKKITVTEVVDFAGEEVTVQKLLNTADVKTGGLRATTGYKRTMPAGSGINSVLNQIGKKKKISVLEKSQHDWNSFKRTEGIAEDLKTHNKGRDGYLDRQDFLERTDLRQFEIEKSLRQSRRNN